MKAVITRVKSASVTVDGVVISQISQGLLALIGIGQDDTPADLKALTTKILSLKMFPAPPPAKGDWKANVKDIGGEILCVSQFTLLARTQKGSKLDFHLAMGPAEAKAMYDDCLAALGQGYDPSRIKDGRFGAMMDVASVNDGPVTVLLDTREKPPSSSSNSSSADPTPSASSVNLASQTPDGPSAISKKQAKWNAKQLDKQHAAKASSANGQSVPESGSQLDAANLDEHTGPATAEEGSRSVVRE